MPRRRLSRPGDDQPMTSRAAPALLPTISTNDADAWFDWSTGLATARLQRGRTLRHGTGRTRLGTHEGSGDDVDLTLSTREADGTPSSPSGERSTSTRPRGCATSSPSWSPPAPTTSSSTCRSVEFLDSTGLGVLVGGLKKVRAHDGSLDLVCTQDRLLKIFRITGLAKVFVIHDSAEAAARPSQLTSARHPRCARCRRALASVTPTPVTPDAPHLDAVERLVLRRLPRVRVLKHPGGHT